MSLRQEFYHYSKIVNILFCTRNFVFSVRLGARLTICADYMIISSNDLHNISKDILMTTEGWIFILLGWGIIITLLVYCFYKILIISKKDK